MSHDAKLATHMILIPQSAEKYIRLPEYGSAEFVQVRSFCTFGGCGMRDRVRVVLTFGLRVWGRAIVIHGNGGGGGCHCSHVAGIGVAQVASNVHVVLEHIEKCEERVATGCDAQVPVAPDGDAGCAGTAPHAHLHPRVGHGFDHATVLGMLTVNQCLVLLNALNEKHGKMLKEKVEHQVCFVPVGGRHNVARAEQMMRQRFRSRGYEQGVVHDCHVPEVEVQ